MTTNVRRLSVGTLVRHAGSVLMVRHEKPGVYDFWVAPGGGVEAGEDVLDAARREAREETGLDVDIGPLGYVEQLQGAISGVHQTKLWFHATLRGGRLATDAASVEREGITAAAWVPRPELADRVYFPPFIAGDGFWQFDPLRPTAVVILPPRTIAYE